MRPPVFRRFSTHLASLLDRVKLPEPVLLAAAGIATGLLAGGTVRLFQAAHQILWKHSQQLVGDVPAPLRSLAWVLLPAVGALAAGLLLARFVGHERHHGVAGIIESVALAGGRLRWWRTPVKALGAIVAIGTGSSVGPEDPSVQLGASAGSMLGQFLRLSRERVRALVAAGGAAGVAAAFNAPIAGLFFGIEVVLGEVGTSALTVAMLASVASAALTQAVVGTHPAFAVPSYAGVSLAELPLFVVLGAAAGLVAVAYVRGLELVRERAARTGLPMPVRAGLAGLAVGLLGLALPQVLGVGYGSVEKLVAGTAGVLPWVLLAIVAAKLAATCLSIGAGVPGGTFAPSLVIGAALGAAMAGGLDALSPAFGASPSAWALVGMAAVLGAAVHAPLTAILLVFELTNDYRAILPTMLGTLTALVVEQRLVGESIYTMALASKGVRIRAGRDVDVLESIHVGEVALSPVDQLPEPLPLADARRRLVRQQSQGLPVVDGGGLLIGMLTLSDLDRAEEEGRAKTVGEIATRDPLVCHADETLARALERMGARGVGRLPVVDRDDLRRVRGLLRRSDVVRAYELARSRRAAQRARGQAAAIASGAEVEVDHLVVRRGSPCDGKSVAGVAWPEGSLLAAVGRGTELVVPRGSTVLRAGDELTVIVGAGGVEALRALCASPER